MSLAAFEALMGVTHLAGYQHGKDRGVFQEPTLLKLEEAGGALGSFLTSVHDAVAAKGAEEINLFLPINGGNPKLKDDGWHDDNPSEGPKGAPNSGRFLMYYMGDTKLGGLGLRGFDEELALDVPRGCMLVGANELLAKGSGVLHKHGANGKSITIVVEYHLPPDAIITTATPEEILAADRAQPQLPFDKYIPLWDPASLFKGSPLKWGFGGCMTERRWAMYFVWGPKFARVTTNKLARIVVAAMGEEELAAAARKGEHAAKSLGGAWRGSGPNRPLPAAAACCPTQ